MNQCTMGLGLYRTTLAVNPVKKAGQRNRRAIQGFDRVYSCARLETNLMRDRVLGARPMAENRLARLACARATAAGIDVGPLMVKAGLTRQQVEEQDARLAAQGQINLLELIAKALRDDLLGFH